MKCVSYFDRCDKNKRKSFVSCSGDPIAKKYEYRYVDGVKQLVVSGETNVQEFIDSFADQCDIHVIIAKFLNGDNSVLNRSIGQFGDFRDCPTTYAEMFDRVQKCENLFKSLPTEIKEKFDNSYEKFWSEFGSNYFDDVFKDYYDVQPEPDAAISDPIRDEVK